MAQMTGAQGRKLTRPENVRRIKIVISKGRTYYYFKSSRRTATGKPILVRLPNIADPSFWKAYAGCCEAQRRDDILTVPKLVELYMSSSKFEQKAATTQRSNSTYLNRLADEFQTAPAAEMNRSDILRVVDKLGPGASNTLVSCVATMYRWARMRGLVDNDPCKDIEKNELGVHDPWPSALIETALASEDDVIRLGVHLLYYTAQRIGDVVKMQWSDIIDTDLHVVQEKTGVELYIHIHAALHRELKKHERSLGTILSIKGKSVTKARLRYRLQIFAKDHGYKIVPHGLRKSAVNSLLEAGCTVAQAAAISGQSLQMVEFYARGRDRKKLGKDAIRKWEKDAQ